MSQVYNFTINFEGNAVQVSQQIYISDNLHYVKQ
jgi:hypothetical protein